MKRFFLVFFLSKVSILFSCPLCLSLPKNADRPFFIEEDADTDTNNETVNFLASKDPIPSTSHRVELSRK
jgi:hypothetical protein